MNEENKQEELCHLKLSENLINLLIKKRLISKEEADIVIKEARK